RFLGPGQNSAIEGDEVILSMVLLAPAPLSRYRVWINGRPFGERGFSLPAPGQKNLILDKNIILDKNLILDKGEARTALAGALPADAGALVRKSAYSHFQQLQVQVPIEETDGAFLRIAVAAESADGRVSDSRIMRLRGPQAEAQRGPLRVLAVGIGAYAHVPRLQFPAADARDLAAALQAQAGEGKLYRSAAVQVLTDDEATLPALRAALAWLTR